MPTGARAPWCPGIWPSWSASSRSAGGRFTHARLGGEGEDVAPQLLAQIVGITAARQETAFLPAASLLARLTPETQLYLRYQQGFRPGGLAIEGPLVRRFENDRNSTFELGLRHGVPGSSPFEMTASFSYTTWRDIQADFIDAGGFPSTANIGDGEVWTASFSAGWRVTRDLRVDAGVTYNDSRVDEPRPEFSILRLTEVPNVARVAGRVGVEYAGRLDNGWDIAARGWAGYVGKSRLGIGPELGDPQGNYLDSGLTVRVGRPDLGVTLGVTNLTDEVGNRFALGTPFATGRDQITPLRPRTVRLGLDASF